MRPPRVLRHDAAVALVKRHLAGDDRGAARARPPSTTAAAVSSQEVSMPSTRNSALGRCRGRSITALLDRRSIGHAGRSPSARLRRCSSAAALLSLAAIDEQRSRLVEAPRAYS